MPMVWTPYFKIASQIMMMNSGCIQMALITLFAKNLVAANASVVPEVLKL